MERLSPGCLILRSSIASSRTLRPSPTHAVRRAIAALGGPADIVVSAAGVYALAQQLRDFMPRYVWGAAFAHKTGNFAPYGLEGGHLSAYSAPQWRSWRDRGLPRPNDGTRRSRGGRQVTNALRGSAAASGDARPS